MRKMCFTAIVFGAFWAISGCDCLSCGGRRGQIDQYQALPFNVYSGQSKKALFNVNGAPNQVETLGENEEMWVYYTNYRPSGTGEMISYNNPSVGQADKTCVVRVYLRNEVVVNVVSNC